MYKNLCLLLYQDSYMKRIDKEAPEVLMEDAQRIKEMAKI